MINNPPNYSDILEQQFYFLQLKKEVWFEQNLFTYQWWFLLFLSLIPWFIWWKMVDRARIYEILSFGMVIAILSSTMDMIGSSFQAWFYPIKLHWAFTAPIAPFYITLIPVVYMICYQYGHRWKSFIIGVILISSFFALGEYVFKFMGIYKENTWKSYYSFPIYTLNAIFTRWLIQQILSVQKGMKKSA
jgi:hypothetical protein